MRLFVSLFVALFAFSATAGGIAFKKKYEGRHPISGTKVTLQYAESGSVRIDVDHTLGRARDLRQVFNSRNSFETVFSLHEGRGEDAEQAQEKKIGAPIAHVVTTGDCQIVESLALIFPSGLQIPLRAVKEQE